MTPRRLFPGMLLALALGACAVARGPGKDLAGGGGGGIAAEVPVKTEPPAELSLSGTIRLPTADLVAHGAANLISDNAARLISDNAARLLSDNAAHLVGNNAGGYRAPAGYHLQGFGLLAAGWTDAATSAIRVALADEQGKLLSEIVASDAAGRFRLPVPARPAFLVAEAAGGIGLARLVSSGAASADLTVDHTVVALKLAALARGGSALPALAAKPIDALSQSVRDALTPGTLPYLDSGAGEVIDVFDQLAAEHASVSARAADVAAQAATERRLEWSLTTVATGSETAPFALGGFAIHPVSGAVYFLPNKGFREVGRLGTDGRITPVASLSVAVQFPISSTITRAGRLLALVVRRAGLDYNVYLARLYQVRDPKPDRPAPKA
ncbi:MAG: hypothetical protein FJZ01_24290 [Candidatus Sericytochromatia bacterium]|nr:hypothetical protein [Candidatus Tanganyikabacteria bacterium]